MPKNRPLTSIITPVFNTEKYLAECIESILAQTYDNWEYLIVDNCSTDGSLAIAETYAGKDNRIRVFRNEAFLDIMPNWNNAVRKMASASKYCKVVHADDWIYPECIEQMVDLCEKHPSVGIAGAYRLEEERVGLCGLPYTAQILQGKQACRHVLSDGIQLFGSPTSVMYRADLVREKGTFYNEDNLHADLEVCFELLQSSDFGFIHQVLTFTRRHNESVSSKSKFFNTHIIGKLLVIKRYGPDFLAPEEYRAVLERTIKAYYRLMAWKLGRLWLRGNSSQRKAYLDYHQQQMKKLGIPYTPSLLAWNLFMVFCQYGANKLTLQ
jgi:glycosyltransferase involved in cell wall biosynthesis